MNLHDESYFHNYITESINPDMYTSTFEIIVVHTVVRLRWSSMAIAYAQGQDYVRLARLPSSTRTGGQQSVSQGG